MNRRDAVAKEVGGGSGGFVCPVWEKGGRVDWCLFRRGVHPDSTHPTTAPRRTACVHPHTPTQILDSEKTFVEQMATLAAVFIKPLRWWQAEIVGGKVGRCVRACGGRCSLLLRSFFQFILFEVDR